MTTTRLLGLALRVIPLLLAAASIALQLTTGEGSPTSRGIRDAVQIGLLAALPWQFFDLVPSEDRAGPRFALRKSPSWVGGAIAAILCGIFMYNGVVAYGNSRCAEAVRVQYTVETSQSRASETACFRER